MRLFPTFSVCIIILTISNQSFAQENNIYEHLLGFITIKKGQEFEFDNSELNQLNIPKFACENDPNFSISNFHLEDLDGNGQKDLIYSGYCQPYEQTLIWLRQGERFKLIVDVAGKLLDIKHEDGTRISISKAPCCCDHFGEFIAVLIDKKDNVVQHRVFQHEDITVSGSELRLTKVMGFLRSKPKVDDTLRTDECSGDTLIGNQILNIPVQSEVLQFNELGCWKLVLYPETENRLWIGWIDQP